LTKSEATRLRQEYWQRYGATLLGLMRHHGTDPHHFLRHTHQFPDLKHMLVLERGLKAMLRRLPGRKFVFSNAPLRYSEAVLELAGIETCFDAVYSVERIRFQPKPAVGGFRYLLRSERLHAHRCIMVEDSLANLQDRQAAGNEDRLGERKHTPALLGRPAAGFRARSAKTSAASVGAGSAACGRTIEVTPGASYPGRP
jgi:putative hydrolase of the HAD superfamily